MSLLENAAQFDHFTFYWCQRRRCRRRLIGISRQVSRSADGYLYGLAGALFWYLEYHGFVLLASFAFALERSLYFFIKKYVRRNRPPDAIPGFISIIQASDKFSFPSGHTSAAFLMATLFSLQFESTLIPIVLYGWASAVGWSRVMLGVHFPTDTLAGATLGSSIALALFNSPYSALVF